MNESSEFIPTRRTLLSRLQDLNDQDSWKDFFDTYWKLIYSAARRSGLTDDEAQDVVQETVISVTRNISKYDPALGLFKNWLLNLTRWRIVDQLRKRPPPKEADYRNRSDTTGTGTMDRIADPAASGWEDFWNEEWEKNMIAVAIERIKHKIDPKHFQVFDLSMLKDWPASQIANALKLNVAQVYLVKHRVSRLIRREVRRLEKKLS